jgi:hypothetical protein
VLRTRRSDNLAVVEYESLCIDAGYRRRVFDRAACQEPDAAFRPPDGYPGGARAELDPLLTERAYSIKMELVAFAREIRS